MIAIVNIDLSNMSNKEKLSDIRRAANKFSNDKKNLNDHIKTP